MWKRIAVYSALAACAGLVAWLQFRSAVGARDPGNRPAAATARAAPDTTGDPYRLQPDVRVLEAAGDLHRLITGGPAEDARADFAEGRWTLTHRGITVGTLPEFPEFGDLERLLSLPVVKSESTKAQALKAARKRDKAEGTERTQEQLKYERSHND